MAEQWRDVDPTNELNDPKNPPNSVLSKGARRAAVLSYLGPVIVLFVIVGIVLIYWSTRGPMTSGEQRENSVIGTSGERTEGGGTADPAFDSTRDELAFKGGDTGVSGTLSSVKAVTSARDAGHQVSIANAEVSAVNQDGSFWIHDGNDRVAVTGADVTAIKEGQHVTVMGTTERDASGALRIRAARVQ